MATFASNPAASPLTGTEIVPIVQGGVDSRTTVQAIVDLAGTNLDYTRTTVDVTVTSDTGSDVALPAASGTYAGVMSAADKTKLDGLTGGAAAPVNALAISSGVVNIDLALGRHFTLTLTANVTSITFANLPASGFAGEIAIRIVQDGTGGRSVTLPTSFKATGGSDTAVASAANAYTLLTAVTFDQGTRWAYAMQEIAA